MSLRAFFEEKRSVNKNGLSLNQILPYAKSPYMSSFRFQYVESVVRNECGAIYRQNVRISFANPWHLKKGAKINLRFGEGWASKYSCGHLRHSFQVRILGYLFGFGITQVGRGHDLSSKRGFTSSFTMARNEMFFIRPLTCRHKYPSLRVIFLQNNALF